jgi:hypothetical protein
VSGHYSIALLIPAGAMVVETNEKREKEARHSWVRKMLITRQRHTGLAQYSLRMVCEEVHWQMADKCDVGGRVVIVRVIVLY